MTEAVRVDGFAIPPVPAGATLNEHSREANPPSPAARQNAPQPTQTEFASILPQAQPQQPAAQPTADPTLLALLAALKQPSNAAPAPAASPAPQPQATQGGDSITSGLTSILAGSGLDVNRAIGKALEFGDASLIDEAYIKEAGGANAAYVAQVAKGLVEHAVREEQSLAHSVYTAAGGEANWRAALGAFESTAPGHLQTIVKALYDSKDRTNVEAATKTILDFARQAGATITPANIFAGAAAGGSVQALDKAGFQAELLKLDKNSRGYEQARAELFVRRHAGKQLGR